MTEFNPLVSIIIPVFNGSNYMKEAIDSALNQTYKNIEVIVVNDGSNDYGKTDAIAKSYGSRIRYIQKENGGVSTALNCGIQNMKGEYFSWLSHDDAYTPSKIEDSILALSKLENKNTLVCCESIHINELSQQIGKIKNKRKIEFLNWEKALKVLLKEGSFNGCALLIPKTVFDVCGKFDETLRFNQDGFMWYKIFLSGFSILLIPNICVKNRIHKEQVTQKRQDLFHKDCKSMSEYLIPRLLEISTKDNNYIFDYIIYNAKYANWSVVKNAYLQSQKLGIVKFKNLIHLIFICVYGLIRPYIRVIYYLMIRKIKTSR